MRTAIYQLTGLAGMFALGMVCGRALRSSASGARRAYLPPVPEVGIGLGRRARHVGPEAQGPSTGPAEATGDVEGWDTYAPSDEPEEEG